MLWLLIIGSLLLLALLAGTEAGCANASRLNIEIKKKQGKRSAKILSEYLDRPDEYMAAAMVGNIIGLTTLCISTFLLLQNTFTTEPFDHLLVQLSATLALAINVVLVLAKLLPKVLFRNSGDALLYAVSLPTQGIVYLLAPFALVLKKLSNFILKYLFNVELGAKRKIFQRPDLLALRRKLKTGKDDQNQNEVNTALFEKALQLSSTRIRECLIPRNEITAVTLDSSFEDIKQVITESKHSKIIVFEQDIDNIIGYVHHLDFYGPATATKELVHNISAVPETMSSIELLNQFNKERKSIAWVVDEFGGTAGIVTQEDILEELFGEIEDEHDEQEYIERQLSKNEYILSGRLEVEYINDKFDLDLPTEMAETLSGYIIEEHNAIPQQKEKIILGKFEFDIILVSKTRIETVKLKVLEDE